MGPRNKYEQIIARAVDEKYLENVSDHYHLIVRDVAMSVDFLMSASDTEFLVDYVQWRHAHPVSGIPTLSGASLRQL